MSMDKTKAVFAYVVLTRTPREQLAEVDLRRLEAAELVMAELPATEFVAIARANNLQLR